MGLATALVVLSAAVAANGWAHRTALDRSGDVHLSWTPDSGRITFLLEVRTRGYVALGLSRSGAMAGSDMAVGWVKDGQLMLEDRHAVGNSVPLLDGQQDWELLGGWENDTHTVLQFSRALDTCDPDDLPISNDTVRVLYAFHPDDPVSGEPKYHGPSRRGSRSIMLLQPSGTGSDFGEDGALYWDALAPNYSLPHDVDTMYWCKILKAPLIPSKHHIYKIEPAIQPGHEGLVHHIILYHCKDRRESEAEPFVDHPGHECHSPNMPDVFDWCEGVFAAWGVGGEVMHLPEHAGLPIGGDEERYFMLEVHYDNPAMVQGVKDSSGLRIFYTPQLRLYDAATLLVGATTMRTMVIPPGQPSFVVAGHGDPRCLADVIPESGLRVFAVFLHAHLLGRKILVRHFRAGQELPYIAVDKNYDFNYQEYRYIPEVVVLPGDHLVVECTYNSSQRDHTTFGGQSTKEEMCLAFFLYYPRVARVASLTVPSSNLVLGLVGIKEMRNYVILKPRGLANQSFHQYLYTHHWDDNYVKVFEQATRFGPHETYCLQGNGVKVKLTSLISYPPVTRPYEEPSFCPRNGLSSAFITIPSFAAILVSLSAFFSLNT